MWSPGQRKAIFEKLKNKQQMPSGGASPQAAALQGMAKPMHASLSPKHLNPYPGDAMHLSKPITGNPPQIQSMPDQFLKPMQSENKQMTKKARLPKLQSFFKAPGV